MQQSKLIIILKKLSNIQIKHLEYFVQSPYFNKKKEVLQFFQHIIRFKPSYSHKKLDKNFILNNVKKISEIPCHIIQGRHDVICPPFNAYILSNKWKNSKLKIVEDGAHSGFEDPMFIEIQKSVNDIFVDID